MDAQHLSTELDAFRRGATWPLSVPESARSEFTINPCLEDQWREWKAENGRGFGYQFPWGQIHEDPTRAVGGADSDGVAMEWHFVLSALQAEFLRTGGDLGELSDCCIAVLEQADGCAHLDFRPELVPAYLSYGEGNPLTAFSIAVHGSGNLSDAREWVADRFMPSLLPVLIDNVRRINAVAEDGTGGS